MSYSLIETTPSAYTYPLLIKSHRIRRSSMPIAFATTTTLFGNALVVSPAR